MIDNDEGLLKRFDEISSLIAAQEKKLLEMMEEHRQKLENVMDTHHEEAIYFKMPVAPADNN